MIDFLFYYTVAACLFNIPYQWFNVSSHIAAYVKELQEELIRKMNKEDPFHPLLKKLESKPLGDYSDLYKGKPLMLLTRDFIFFPINLTLLCFIVVDKMSSD